MEQVQDIIRMLFTRDLQTSPLETTIFLIVVFGFFAFLAVAGVMRRGKEQKRVSHFLNDKWDSLCRIYQLNDDEIALLEEISAYLKNPEKKYLLLVNYQAFHDSLQAYSQEHTVD